MSAGEGPALLGACASVRGQREAHAISRKRRPRGTTVIAAGVDVAQQHAFRLRMSGFHERVATGHDRAACTEVDGRAHSARVGSDGQARLSQSGAGSRLRLSRQGLRRELASEDFSVRRSEPVEEISDELACRNPDGAKGDVRSRHRRGRVVESDVLKGIVRCRQQQAEVERKAESDQACK